MIRTLNMQELACDLAITAFAYGIARYYDSIMSYAIGSVPFPVIFLMGSLYFIPVLIGKIYNTTFTDADTISRKFVIFTMITNIGSIFIYTLYYLMKKTPLSEGMQITLGVLTFVILIMAPIAGMIFTDRSNDAEGISSQILISLLTLGMFPLFILLVNGRDIFGEHGGLADMFIVVALMFGDVLFIILLFVVLLLLKKAAIALNFYMTFLRGLSFLVPFFTAFLLVIFNIHASRLIFTTFGSGTLFSKILLVFAFIFSGVLPLRIILAIKPPYTVINVLSGVLSSSVLFISIFR